MASSERLMSTEHLLSKILQHTAQKMKFSIKDFFYKCDEIRRKPRIWSHLLKKSLMENSIFCAVPGKIAVYGPQRKRKLLKLMTLLMPGVY